MEFCLVTDHRALTYIDMHTVTKSRNLFYLHPLLFPPPLKVRLQLRFLDLKGKYFMSWIQKCQSQKGYDFTQTLVSMMRRPRPRQVGLPEVPASK